MLCARGHAVEIVGRYGNGACKVCQRAASKRWASKQGEGYEKIRARRYRERQSLVNP